MGHLLSPSEVDRLALTNQKLGLEFYVGVNTGAHARVCVYVTGAGVERESACQCGWE